MIPPPAHPEATTDPPVALESRPISPAAAPAIAKASTYTDRSGTPSLDPNTALLSPGDPHDHGLDNSTAGHEDLPKQNRPAPTLPQPLTSGSSRPMTPGSDNVTPGDNTQASGSSWARYILYRTDSSQNPNSPHRDDITEVEGEQEDIEAAEQAEGTIVADSDESATDGGYGSDTVSAASTSLSSSVQDYLYENGRRYHRFREGRYNFPNDDAEQEREDLKHVTVKLLCQHLHFAPIGEIPQQILDIGTGTGTWSIEMGDQFPSANILGIDLSPIQPDWVPPNVKFMVDDAESVWLHPRNHFDYIHSRHTVMAIKDWPRLFRRALEHLRPGGWMELQEILHYPVSVDGSMAPDHPVAQYWTLIKLGLNNLGVDFHAAGGGKLADMMREAGFVNITERVFHIPIGTWPKNRLLKTVGLYWRTVLTDGIQGIALGPLTRGCGWSREQVELFLVDVRKGYQDNSAKMYMPLHIIYGQKSENDY